MKVQTRIVVLFALALAWSGTWAADGSEPLAPGKLPERIKLGIVDAQKHAIGASFDSPEGEGWNLSRSGTGANLLRKSDADGASWQVEAYLIQPDVPFEPLSNYMESIRNALTAGLASNRRFKLAKLDVTPDAGDTRCVRTHLLLQGLPAEGSAFGAPATWSEQFARSCGFRSYKKLGVEVRYFHRYAGVDADPRFAGAANRLLDSMTLDEQ